MAYNKGATFVTSRYQVDGETLDIQNALNETIEDVGGIKTDASSLPVTSSGGNTPITLGDWFSEVTNVKSFGAKGDGSTDDTLAIQSAIDYAFQQGTAVYLPPGNYITTDTLSLQLPEGGSSVFGQKKVKLFGDGRNIARITNTYSDSSSPIPILSIDTASNSAGYNPQLSGFSVAGVTSVDPAVDGVVFKCTIGYGDFEDIYIQNTRDALVSEKNMFLTRLNSIMASRPWRKGFDFVISGTSCEIDRLFVALGGVDEAGSENGDFVAYRLPGVYMSIGALAADNCVGTLYDFRFLSGHVQSLGSEQVIGTFEPSSFLRTGNGNLEIGYCYTLNATDDPDYIHHWHTGSGVCEIGVVRTSEAKGRTQLSGRLALGTGGKIKHSFITCDVDFTYALSTAPANSSIYEIGNAGTGVTYSRFDRRAYIGARRGIYETGGCIESSRNVQAIWMDSAQNWSSGESANYSSTAGPDTGDWVMNIDPASHNCAGFSTTSGGSSWSAASAAPILTGQSGATTERPPSPAINTIFWDTTLDKAVWYRGGGVWKDMMGTEV